MEKINDERAVGFLERFPTQIINALLAEQVRQGNKEDVSVFQKFFVPGYAEGGFDFSKSKEGDVFWKKLFISGNFKLFFDTYPTLKIAIPKEDFNQEMEKLGEEFQSKKKELIKRYCESRNPYKIGDTFTDNSGESLRITKIQYVEKTYLKNIPCCVYHGLILTKKGEVRKDGQTGWKYQTQDINWKEDEI